MTEHILLVLGIAEGRHFPKRPHHQLLVEANFDGEILNTDVIKHVDAPKFNTELAWEIDKKSLHQHRLQRTPIKIQVYAVESSSAKKESAGYFILDLRSAQQDGLKKASWHLLLSSKYQHMKPELKTTLSIEVDQVKVNENKKAPGPFKEKSPLPVDENNNLDVVLDNEQGYYLIGPETKGCETFVLSVSIGGARNLVKLLPSNANVKSEDGFYFYYSLFDNDVTNETFYDLISQTMPTERATVRIYTTTKRLEHYLKKKRVLEVYLCSVENTLGQATVALEPLTHNSFNQPNAIEGLFRINTQSKMDPLNSDETDALVGVSLILRKELHTAPLTMSPVLAQYGAKVPSKSPINDMRRSPTPKVTPIKKPMEIRQDKQKQMHQQIADKQEKNHHFLYSIDIRSISNMDINRPTHCICRYTYPFFGSSSPIITNPPVFVQRNSEVLLPQSFCKFEFASTNQLLQSTLARVPMIIEVWSKDSNVKDELLGIAQIHLSDVFQADNKNAGGQLVKSEKITVVSANNPGQRVGIIHIVLGFEDRGEISSKIPARHEQSFSSSNITTEPISEPVEIPRNTQEYQVAMALELWRQQQEEHFKLQLSSKENERMKTLADEWKQRDMEREMLLKRKIDEYNLLETRLKSTLEDLGQREKQVTEKELKLERSEKLLAEEYERKTVEMREASRRLKEDYQHQLHLERARYGDLEEKHKLSVAQTREGEIKLKERENEIYALKESMFNRPEVKMQSEMNMLLLEKNEMERKIESVTKSKIHYKQQWGRALRELARFKVNEQEAAKLRLKKQQQELDHMKLRYIAVEEKEVMKSEKDEMENVKEEINKRLEELQLALKQQAEQQQQQQTTDQNLSDQSESTEQFFHKNRIAKLIEERDTLLQTGVYTADDRVIVEIEKEIQQLISQN